MKKEELKIGDKIRLLHVPQCDLDDRAKAQADEGWIATATVLEYLFAHNPIVTIDQIDEYKQPWFSAIMVVDGEEEEHSIALMDDDSWEKVSE